MRYLIVSTMLVFLTLTTAVAEELRLDVQQAVDYALANNPLVKAYGYALDESEAGIKQSRSGFLPTLSVDYSARRLYNNASQENDSDYLSQRSGTFNVRLTQPVFSGFRASAEYSKAHLNKELRQTELERTMSNLELEARSSFYTYHWAQLRATKWQESVNRLLQQEQIVSAWVDQQLAPRLRRLEIAVELAHARQQLTSAQSAKIAAESELRSLLAVPANLELVLVASFADAPFDYNRSADYFIEQALTNRPELKTSVINMKMAREDLRITRSRKLPRISLEAAWTDFDRSYRSSSVPSDDRNYYTVSLNVSMQPFQGGATYYTLRQQQLYGLRLGQEQLNLRNSIVSEIRTLYEQLSEGSSRIESAEQGMLVAQEAYEFVNQASRIGTASVDALLDAELRLTRAELDLLDAFHQQQQLLVQFEHAVGLY